MLFDMLSQGIIDHDLVVAAAGFMHLMPEQVQDIRVNPDGNAGFLGLGRDDGPRLPLLKSYSSLINPYFPFKNKPAAERPASNTPAAPAAGPSGAPASPGHWPPLGPGDGC